jgi:hypothetical protein
MAIRSSANKTRENFIITTKDNVNPLSAIYTFLRTNLSAIEFFYALRTFPPMHSSMCC